MKQEYQIYFEVGQLFLLIAMIIIAVSILYRYLKRRFPVDDTLDTSFPFYFTHFEPANGLELQTPFWASIFVPVILFLCTGVFAWWGTTPDVSAEGFETFLSTSQLPIGLLALAIPLAVLTGRIHGTKQTALQIEKTKLQIEETQKKNKTDLYLAHYKHFCEHLSEIEKNLNSNELNKFLIPQAKFTFNKKLTYKTLFPKSSLSYGITEISPFMFKSLDKTIVSIYEESSKIIKNQNANKRDFRNFFVEVSSSIEMIFLTLGIASKPNTIFKRSGTFPLLDDEVCYVSSFNQILDFTEVLETIINDIYQFDSNFDLCSAPEHLHLILSIIPLFNDKSVKEVEAYLNRSVNDGWPIDNDDWKELDDLGHCVPTDFRHLLPVGNNR
ncbi:hypothetical protein ACVBKF_00245 [Shewanella sp. 0m-11]